MSVGEKLTRALARMGLSKIPGACTLIVRSDPSDERGGKTHACARPHEAG
jgi:hypothetical protein